MSSYKVIQDVEAEDKLLGPLTLRQFIYALVAAFNFFLTFVVITKGLAPVAIVFLPFGLASGFFAFPWGRDQPTEVWALAKIRFFVKPRKRIWNQSGIKELVTITVPKKIEQVLTNNLSQTEIKSRLQALAETIDTRGWATKNINVAFANPVYGQTYQSSDRLVSPVTSLTQAAPVVDVRASDDVLDEQNNPVAHQFDNMIAAADKAKHDRLIAQMHAAEAATQPAYTRPQNAATVPATAQQQQPPANNWFMNQPASPQAQNAPQVVQASTGMAVAPTPTPEEEQFIKNLPEETPFTSSMHGHIRNIQPPSEQPAPTPQQPKTQTNSGMTQQPGTAILDLSRNDDYNIATIAREAQKRQEQEVVVKLR